MKIDSHHASEPLVPVTLRIRQKDISEMDYHLNECPMSNPALQNAVSIALRRIVNPNLDVAVRAGKNGAVADIGRWRCPLGSDVGSWLGKVLIGFKAQPAKFKVLLPKSAVVQPQLVKTKRKTRFENESAELTALSA